MDNYTRNTVTNQEICNTFLKIMGDISHLFGNEVPYPHSHYYSNEYNRMVYCWVIDGFFHTQKNVRFINDVIARFKITADCQLHSLKASTVKNISSIKLKQFQGLKSLANDRLKDLNVNTYINSDYVYTCIVLQAEKYIKINGLIDYSVLEAWAFENFIDIAKDKSTLKAKCRNCWNWYFDRNWALYHTVRIKKDKELVMANRVEHAIKLSAKNEEIAKQKVYNAQRLIKYFNEQDGKLSLRAIERQSGCSINTVRKHFIEWDRI